MSGTRSLLSETMSRFIPPSFNLPVAWTVDFTFPVLIKLSQNIEGIEIQSEDRRMLRSLSQNRLIFFSNHPSTSEPPVAYHVANTMGARFRFMASRQVFDQSYGFMGRLIQGLGAFSVVAGAPDRDAVRTARETLAEPRGKLVLYPEGEPTSGENDNLLPFQQGIAQLGFWGLEDARKVDEDAEITVLPGFVKYVYTANESRIRADLTSAIARIEAHYEADPGNRNLLRRYLAVGRILLEEAEGTYHIPPASRRDFDYRVGRVRHTILDAVADRLIVPHYDRKADAIAKLRRLLSVIELHHLGEAAKGGLPPITAQELAWAETECKKAYDFIVVKPEYLISRPTPERFYEWLARFETHVFGSSEPRPRKAVVSFAPPFPLSEYYAPYKKERRAGIDELLGRLRRDLQGLLEQSTELTAPMERPYDVGDDVV